MSFAVQAAQNALNCRSGRPLASYLFNASAEFFTYEPVLRALQGLSAVPLGEVLVHLGQAPRLTKLAHGDMQVAEFSSDIQKAVETDPSQKQALQLALDKSVVLVQGPPGTGKTYIGVQIVKAMLQAQARKQGPKLRILCLCFTNHALDSFLESLLDASIDKEKFIRLGHSEKISQRLKPRCLGELTESKLTSSESWSYGALKKEETLTEEI
eukprot:g63803.t1